MMPSARMYGYALAVSACYFIFTAAAAHSTHPSEVNALLEVKKSLIDPTNHLRNWNEGDPCALNWTGVFCFDRVGPDGFFHVRELFLMTMNLSGSLAPQLGQLSHLKIMNFMWNALTGTIPKEIGNITSLELLLLNGNALSGTLPDELGYLSNLNRLQVDQNQLSGPIPQSFANLTSVKHVQMNNNSLNGQLPPNLSNLSSLLHLLVENNNFSGYLPPEFSMLQELRILQFDNNNFRGTIPSTYANLSRLAKLSLRNCSLQGDVPDLSSLPKLYYLDLSWNHLTGHIPSNKLADNITTIDLSNNHLNGSLPGNISAFPSLQRLSLENNFLSGSISARIWLNISFSSSAKLTVDLRNNSLSDILGDLNPPHNVTLRLGGNPVCKDSLTSKILVNHCGVERLEEDKNSTNSTTTCPVHACPVDDFFEYVSDSPVPCFCASPLRIGYQLKSPSFSFFPPYMTSFKLYVTQSLKLDLYQLSIDSYAWEEGPRLRMYLKLFPMVNDDRSNVFNTSEVHRIRSMFTSWKFPGSDFFGPYENLNFTLLGPYADLIMESDRREKSTVIIALAIVAALGCVVAICAVAVIVRRHVKYTQKPSRKSKSSNISIKIDGMKEFTYKELALATENFSSSTEVGQGGYGKVYKGILPDATVVAIKRAQEGSLQGQKEFLTEIELLSRLHHRNLVSLIGYCGEEGEQMLVYEFMPNGTLRDWLSGKTNKNLNFGMRLRIALGSAKGILYLHTEANPPIFHRDVKSSNILLDSKIIAKVADFGLSRLAPCLDDDGTEPKHVSTVVKGTPGYLDPEYLLTGKLTDKSDVYSLGVVFLELLTGMQPITRGKNIVREVNMARQSGMIFSIIDSRMGFYPSDCVERFSTLALSCCHDNVQKRPSMVDVVRELENIVAMLPGTEDTFSDINSRSDGKLESSASNMMGEDQHVSSAVSETGLVSGVIPTINPR